MAGSKKNNYGKGKAAAASKKKGGGQKAGGASKKCPLAELHVTVVREDKTGDPNFDNTIRIEGPKRGRATEKCDKEHIFSKLKPGKYKVTAKPEKGKGYSFDKPVKEQLGASDKKKVTITLKKLEIVEVTPTSDVKRYVNLKARKSEPDWGRVQKVEAKLNRKKKGVTVYFDFEPDAGNRANLPGKLKAKITKSAKTNSKGIAKAKFTVSEFGGDKFKVMASLFSDVKHASSNAKKSKTITVWRKVWYQITQDKGTALPARTTNKDAFKTHFAEMEEIDNKSLTYKSAISGLTDHPLWQFRPGGGDRQIVCVGSHNKKKFWNQFKRPSKGRKPKAHLIICDVQWDPKNGPQKEWEMDSGTKSFYQKNSAGNDYLGVFDSPLAGGKIVKSGSWKWNDGTVTHTGKLSDANVKVKKARSYTCEFEVSLPATCKRRECKGCKGGTNIQPTAGKKAKAKLRLRCATGPWAGESGSKAKPHCLIVADSNSNKFNNTIAHEIAHLFDAVRTATNFRGIPDHTDQYVKRGGQGSHCKKGASEHATETDQDGNKAYTGGTCIMYHVAVGNTTFCDQCGLDVQVRDLSTFY